MAQPRRTHLPAIRVAVLTNPKYMQKAPGPGPEPSLCPFAAGKYRCCAESGVVGGLDVHPKRPGGLAPGRLASCVPVAGPSLPGSRAALGVKNQHPLEVGRHAWRGGFDEVQASWESPMASTSQVTVAGKAATNTRPSPCRAMNGRAPLWMSAVFTSGGATDCR